jgi:hypothetical protein
MKPLYTTKEFNLAKSFDKLPCECYHCKQPFLIYKTRIVDVLRPNNKVKTKAKYCSKECSSKARSLKITYQCHHCGKECVKKASQIKLSKSGFNFCSKHCTSSYHIKHKNYGTNRSKLEQWIAEQLIIKYPDLNIKYNDTETLNGLELDIYIPSLQIAFELNGVFHYEPIFGQDKLDKTIKKDKNKMSLCLENKIDLCIIDTTSQKYFKEHTSHKFLDIILNIIQQRL